MSSPVAEYFQQKANDWSPSKAQWYIVPISDHICVYGPFKRKKDAVAYMVKWCVIECRVVKMQEVKR